MAHMVDDTAWDVRCSLVLQARELLAELPREDCRLIGLGIASVEFARQADRGVLHGLGAEDGAY